MTDHVMDAFLLSSVNYDDCLALQRKIVEATAGHPEGRITLLLCEHPELITIGRGGSPAEVRMDAGPIRKGQIEVRWVKRGGRCIVHAPGQVAIYPIVPLHWHGFSVGDYLERLEGILLHTLEALGYDGQAHPSRDGIWGRTGQLAAMGVAVRNWTTYHGAFLNVAPPLGLFRLVETDPTEPGPMSCLVAERRKPVRMTQVRAELIRQFAAGFECEHHNLHTGHPWLRQRQKEPE